MNFLRAALHSAAISLFFFLGLRADAADLLNARVTNVPVDAACRVLTELSGENVVFIGDMKQRVSFELNGHRFDDAIGVVAARSSLLVRRVGNVSLLFDEQHRRIVEAIQERDSQRISLHVENRSLLWVVQAISRLSGFEIAYMGAPRSVQSLHLNDVPWEQLLDILAGKYGLRVERRKSTISLRDRS